MNFFEITTVVNKNKNLNFAQKALLNQIIGFNLNELPFIATNRYLADYWGCDISTIKRSLDFLEEAGYIKRFTDKKKHTVGEKTWYNKRYITPIYDAILGSDFIPTKHTDEQPIEFEVEVPRVTIETKDPIFFDYPENEEGDTITDEMFFQNISTPPHIHDGPKADELEHLLEDEPTSFDEKVSLYTFLPSLGLSVPDVMLFIEDVDASNMLVKDIIAQINKYMSQLDNGNYAGPTLPENIHERINNYLQMAA